MKVKSELDNNQKGKVLKEELQLEIWIQQIAEGDLLAFHDFYEMTYHRIYGFAYALLKHPEDAQDCMQETYLKIKASSKSYQPQGKPMAWIFTIVKNNCYTKFKTGNPIQGTVPLEEIERIPDETDIAGKFELQEQVNALLKRLPEQDCLIVTLHLIYGWKHREISDMLKLPIGTVLSKYNRSIQKLGKHWKGEKL